MQQDVECVIFVYGDWIALLHADLNQGRTWHQVAWCHVWHDTMCDMIPCAIKFRVGCDVVCEHHCLEFCLSCRVVSDLSEMRSCVTIWSVRLTWIVHWAWHDVECRPRISRWTELFTSHENDRARHDVESGMEHLVKFPVFKSSWYLLHMPSMWAYVYIGGNSTMTSCW